MALATRLVAVSFIAVTAVGHGVQTTTIDIADEAKATAVITKLTRGIAEDSVGRQVGLYVGKLVPTQSLVTLSNVAVSAESQPALATKLTLEEDARARGETTVEATGLNIGRLNAYGCTSMGPFCQAVFTVVNVFSTTTCGVTSGGTSTTCYVRYSNAAGSSCPANADGFGNTTNFYTSYNSTVASGNILCAGLESYVHDVSGVTYAVVNTENVAGCARSAGGICTASNTRRLPGSRWAVTHEYADDAGDGPRRVSRWFLTGPDGEPQPITIEEARRYLGR